MKKLFVNKSSIHGYGVFAGENIKKGDIIEECYCILTEECSCFSNYAFAAKDKSSVVLGFGTIYNHSTEYQNAYFEFEPKRTLMVFKALRNIVKGEEIFTRYGKDWFQNKNLIEITPSRLYQIKRFIKLNRALFRATMFTIFLFLLLTTMKNPWLVLL